MVRIQKVLIRLLPVLLTAYLLLSGCSKEEEKKVEVIRPVKTLTVQTGAVGFSHGFPGKVRAAKRSELSFKVAGPLVELPVEEGQRVKKGDLVAQIQKRDFQTSLNEAKARNLEAEKQFGRYKELYAKKQVSRADYDRYRASRDVTRAQFEDARHRLQDTTLTAPFDGVISKRLVENFQKVQAKEAIASLQDISRIEILINVPELLMAALKKGKGQQIRVSFESIPGREYEVSVKEFSPQADPATQTYQVVLLMDQPEEANILPGMTAMVTTLTDSDSGTVSRDIIIPAIAVMDGPGDKAFVWLFDPGKSTVRKAWVTIGRLEGKENVVVKGGLQNGDVLVITGITKLTEGMEVRLWEK